MIKGEITGRCGTCRHPDRWRVELLLAGGASHTATARKFALHIDSVRRHWINHVSPERKAALAQGPVIVADLAARLADDQVSVLDHLKNVRAGLYAMFDAAVVAGDRTGTALIAAKLHENLNILVRLTGVLSNSTMINIQNNFILSPEFAAVQSTLLRILADHPAARDAVILEFRQLEQRGHAPALIESSPQAHDAA